MSNDLRDRIAAAIHTPHHFGGKPVAECVSACWQRADAVMAVVQPEIDRLDRVRALCDRPHVISVPTLDGEELAPVIWPHELLAALDGPDE